MTLFLIYGFILAFFTDEKSKAFEEMFSCFESEVYIKESVSGL